MKYGIIFIVMLLIINCAHTGRYAHIPQTVPLQYPGGEKLIDYTVYGTFHLKNTDRYRYQIKDLEGLKLAAGAGIYPNVDFITLDTLYQQLKNDSMLGGNPFTESNYPVIDFFRIATAKENWGIRQFSTGLALERGKEYFQAIKAYYATIVHFPTEHTYTEGQDIWYVAKSAMARIAILVKKHPELALTYKDYRFEVRNTDDLDVSNDIVIVSPGNLRGKPVGSKVLTGIPHGYARTEETRDITLLKKPVTLSNFGDAAFINYSQYGTFEHNDGSGPFSYTITDSAGLAKAAGEGVYPNESDIFKNELFTKLNAANWLGIECFESFGYNSPLLQYLKFATSTETSNPGRSINRGEKLFFTGVALQNAAEARNDIQLVRQAIKAYYGVIVHFPGDASMARDSSYVWYPAKASIGKIQFLLKQFPELQTELESVVITIKNEFDIDTSNDTISITLGNLVPSTPKKLPDLEEIEIIEKRCAGKKPGTFDCKRTVYAQKYANGHWELIVKGEPYMVKGMSYFPTIIGNSPKDGTLKNWMHSDKNYNQKADAPYDTWVDLNRNNTHDSDEPVIGDFALMRDMGVNTIRYYHVPVTVNNTQIGKDRTVKMVYNSKQEFDKNVLRDMYTTYGIRMIMGDYLGAYLIGSGADPKIGTDYRDPVQREKLKQIVKDFVLDHKDEDYVLMWAIGNENNMRNDYEGANTTNTLAAKHPKAYGMFLNEVAAMIHELDPNHPVMTGNLETQLIEQYSEYTPEIDIMGINAYRGKEGFGDLFQSVQKLFDRPLLVSEYGSDVLDIRKDGTTLNETSQKNYHKGSWSDIKRNSAGQSGFGTCIGGVPFEWVDEWWKSDLGPKNAHDLDKDAPMPFQDGWSSEEFFGIMSQGAGFDSPFLRQPREVYYYYKDVWNND